MSLWPRSAAPGGGYRLTRKLRDIPVAAVISAIDGPIALTACVEGGDCTTQRLCPMHGRWDPVNMAIQSALSGITLADMAGSLPLFMRAFEPVPVAPEPPALASV